MMRYWTRREVLTLLGSGTASAILGMFGRTRNTGMTVYAESNAPLLPLAKPRQLDVGPRVVHVHAPEATSWNFGSDWYGNYIDQDVVSRMVDRGITSLTGTSSRREAWQTLLPSFQPGQRIAIKVNFNNYIDGDDHGAIDAVIEPVNALIAGLLERGFAAQDISVYDVSHAWHDGGIPLRFVSGCVYPGVQFVGYLNNPSPFSSTEHVRFNAPNPAYAIEDLAICNVLVHANYLINMPIVKSHPFSGVTLGFKNHFGSLEHCDYIHPYTPGYSDYNVYSPDYSPLVAIYLNPHIRNKTILTVGDCLFGAWADPIGRPQPWVTFGNGAPNSLFLACDPVAIECVMTDILAAETTLLPETDDFLQLAGRAGLGVYERGNPWTNDYQQIEYIRVGLVDIPDQVQIPSGCHPIALDSELVLCTTE